MKDITKISKEDWEQLAEELASQARKMMEHCLKQRLAYTFTGWEDDKPMTI